MSTCDPPFSIVHGELDIVPRASGTYDDLAAKVAALTAHGVDDVRVRGIADRLARLTVPRREKDPARVDGLRWRQRQLHDAGLG